MTRPSLATKIYRALFDISHLRQEVLELGGKLQEGESTSLSARCNALESEAIRLLDCCTPHERIRGH